MFNQIKDFLCVFTFLPFFPLERSLLKEEGDYIVNVNRNIILLLVDTQKVWQTYLKSSMVV